MCHVAVVTKTVGRICLNNLVIMHVLGWLCYREECPPTQRPQKIFEAENYLIQSKELEPNCGKTYYYLGRCYGELQDRAHDAFVYYRLIIYDIAI